MPIIPFLNRLFNVGEIMYHGAGILQNQEILFGDTCIEIKTTTGNQSTHMINNLNQVDPR